MAAGDDFDQAAFNARVIEFMDTVSTELTNGRGRRDASKDGKRGRRPSGGAARDTTPKGGDSDDEDDGDDLSGSGSGADDDDDSQHHRSVPGNSHAHP